MFSVQTFGTGGGKLVTILGPQEEAQKLRPDVKIQSTCCVNHATGWFANVVRQAPSSTPPSARRSSSEATRPSPPAPRTRSTWRTS